MKKESIYLDTSVPSAYFDSRAKERQEAAIRFWREILPEKYINDALHIAIGSCNNISYIVSWNFEHIVKVKTRRIVKLVNTIQGYKEIEIISPQEL